MTTKERPIPFSGPMVRAILKPGKTQTRRLVRFGTLKPGVRAFRQETVEAAVSDTDKQCMADYILHSFRAPYGIPGDRLWVRETWCEHIDNGAVFYAADNYPKEAGMKWRSPYHMPRWASRITLEVTDVRAERVQDITEADAIAEGFASVAEFAAFWDTLNAKRSPWARNDWLWVYGFKVLTAAAVAAKEV